MIHYMTTNGVGNAWVGNELQVLQRHALPFSLHALYAPDELFFTSPTVAELSRAARTLYPLPLTAALSIVKAPFFFRRRFLDALVNAITGPRESFRARLKTLGHFLVACHWACTVRKERVDLVHSQWIHSAGSVAMYGAWLLGVPFSFTGHAVDLFRDRVALLDKIRRADFIVCISEFHRAFYLDHGAREKQLVLAYCGIDLELFSVPARTEARPDRPIRILSSGRLVEKKGFSFLIDACRILAESDLEFQCEIRGSGELEGNLDERIKSLGFGDRLELTPKALKQEEIPEVMHRADIYCLACVWSSDDDVDGLPQMLMEAMACGLPVVSTRLVGIPDLVIDGETGLLVPPNDASALAEAIAKLAKDPALRQRLADAGREHVAEKFDLRTSLDPLLEQFRRKLERGDSSTG